MSSSEEVVTHLISMDQRKALSSRKDRHCRRVNKQNFRFTFKGWHTTHQNFTLQIINLKTK
uniref:Uncharacterized protein n=1 Tax=Arundo donax TaxID=35708 RepID=A0A0A9T237_ARUDO